MSFSNADVSKHINDLKSSGLSGKALEDRIHNDAKKFGVSTNQVSQATGWTGSQINNWTQQNNKSALSSGNSSRPSTTSAAARPSSASTPASNNGYSDQDIRDYASHIGVHQTNGGFSANNGHGFQMYQKANELGINDDQINRALGLSGDRTAQEWKRRMGLLQEEREEPTQRAMGGPPQAQWNAGMLSANRLDEMLASDSPLMQRAATQGRQTANARGLLNSSMAAEASQGAMIDRATPFALQDSRTTFDHEQRNVDRQQQAYMSNLNTQNDLQKMQAQYGFSSQLSTQEANQSLNEMYAMSSANGWGVMANNLTDIIGQYSGQLERIQMNPDIAEADKVSLIEQVLTMRDSDIAFQQSLYNELPNYLANTGVFPNR